MWCLCGFDNVGLGKLWCGVWVVFIPAGLGNVWCGVCFVVLIKQDSAKFVVFVWFLSRRTRQSLWCLYGFYYVGLSKGWRGVCVVLSAYDSTAFELVHLLFCQRNTRQTSISCTCDFVSDGFGNNVRVMREVFIIVTCVSWQVVHVRFWQRHKLRGSNPELISSNRPAGGFWTAYQSKLDHPGRGGGQGEQLSERLLILLLTQFTCQIICWLTSRISQR